MAFFPTEINQDQVATEARKEAEQRVNYLQKINRVYKGNIGFVLSSELSKQEEYQQNLEVLIREGDRNFRFRELVLRAVPTDRLNQSNLLRYTFEELATIQTMNTDIKIGPKYEVHYDEAAREFAPVVGFNKYVAIHITKSLPFGKSELSGEKSRELEEYGLTPYKKGSKGLSDCRIDPINDDVEKVKELIGTTENIKAVIDLLVITEQAKQRLGGKSIIPTFFAQNGQKMYLPTKPFKYDDPELAQTKHLKTLQDLAFGSYIDYIHKPLSL